METLEVQLQAARKALRDHEEDRELARGIVARLEVIEDKLDDLEDLIREGGITRFGEVRSYLTDADDDDLYGSLG